MSLKNKVAIVTGGARGIGFAISEKFVNDGAIVVIADILEEGLTASKSLGEKCIFYKIDLTERTDIFKMADDINARFGKIDILVNCAGVAKPVPTFQLTEELLDFVIDINMKAPLYCSQAVGKHMKNNGGGSIINISSGNTQMINVGRTPYGITKGAVNLLTKQLAAEWAIYNIRVNAIAPGWIKTEMVERPLKSGILDEKKILSVSPIQRFGKPEEIADLALFLASESSTYIVGQIIFADGGWNLGIMPDGLDYIRENDREEL